MKTRTTILKAVALLISFAAGSLSSADYYKLPAIKKIDQDVYRSGKILIETRFCFHFIPYGEDAILKYEGRSAFSGSKIIWEDNSSCDVTRVVVMD